MAHRDRKSNDLSPLFVNKKHDHAHGKKHSRKRSPSPPPRPTTGPNRTVTVHPPGTIPGHATTFPGHITGLPGHNTTMPSHFGGPTAGIPGHLAGGANTHPFMSRTGHFAGTTHSIIDPKPPTHSVPIISSTTPAVPIINTSTMSTMPTMSSVPSATPIIPSAMSTIPSATPIIPSAMSTIPSAIPTMPSATPTISSAPMTTPLATTVPISRTVLPITTTSAPSARIEVKQIESGIKLTVDGKDYFINHGTAYPTPTITSLSKSMGAKDEYIHIYGDNFVRGAFVLWGDITITDPWVISKTEIKVRVPKTLAVAMIRISNPDFEVSNSVEFTSR